MSIAAFFTRPMRILRALLAVLACPGIVAGLIPAFLVRHAPSHPALALPGAGLLALGAGLLLWCVRDFFVAGRGTLAPWDPPRHLVIVGLYRHVRNPMYLAVLALVAGWSVLYASPWTAGYAALLALIFHVRVTRFEEPWLRGQFGAGWESYSASVPRWVPSPGPKPIAR